MSEPITGKAAMTREEAKQLIADAVSDLSKAMGKGGASVQVGVQDQRFTKLIAWVWVSIGSIALLVSAWGVNSVQELNIKVGVLISQRERDADEVKDLRDELKEIRGHIRTLEQRK